MDHLVYRFSSTSYAVGVLVLVGLLVNLVSCAGSEEVTEL